MTTDEKVRAFTRLCRSLELQQLVARVGWCDLPWSCPLQPLQSHCHPPLHYSWPPTGPQRPSPRSALSKGQLCNAVQFFCKTASSASLPRKVHLVRPGPILLSGEGRGARLARIVGKQVGSWSNWHGLHQLGGSTRRLLLQAKGKRGSDWRRVLDPNSRDLDTTLESRLWGIE